MGYKESAVIIFPHLKEFSFLPCHCMKYIYHTWMLAVIPKPKLRLNKLANGDWLFSGSSHTYTHHPMHQLQVISKTLLYGYSIKVEWRAVRRWQLHHIGLQSLYTALHIATKCNKISKCSKNIEAHQSIRLRCSGSHSMSVRVADICQDTVRDIQRRNHVLSLRLTSPVQPLE